MPGPVPKRSDQRRRTNSPAVETAQVGPSKVRIPGASSKWHPVARRWFQSLRRSGQSRFYEESDWATAYLIAEAISREMNPQPMVVGSGSDAAVEMVSLPPKGASLTAWLRAMSSLMVTEGDRRRLRLELERSGSGDGQEAPDVAWIDDARNRLRGQSG